MYPLPDPPGIVIGGIIILQEEGTREAFQGWRDILRPLAIDNAVGNPMGPSGDTKSQVFQFEILRFWD